MFTSSNLIVYVFCIILEKTLYLLLRIYAKYPFHIAHLLQILEYSFTNLTFKLTIFRKSKFKCDSREENNVI